MIKCTTALLASLILAGCTGTDTDIEANPGPAVEAALEIARADPTDDRMDLPFVNWFVGEQSKLYDDWSIQGVPTYIAVDRDGLVLGRSHEVEALYEVILEASGADEATRTELVADGVATP